MVAEIVRIESRWQRVEPDRPFEKRKRRQPGRRAPGSRVQKKDRNPKHERHIDIRI